MGTDRKMCFWGLCNRHKKCGKFIYDGVNGVMVGPDAADEGVLGTGGQAGKQDPTHKDEGNHHNSWRMQNSKWKMWACTDSANGPWKGRWKRIKDRQNTHTP